LHLPRRLTQSIVGLGVNKIANRLGFTQLQPAISYCSQGEFTWRRHARIKRERRIDECSQQDRRAVTMKFDYILSRKRMGRLEIADECLVQNFIRGRIDQSSQRQEIWRWIESITPAQCLQDAKRCRTTQANHTNATATWRRS